MRKTFAKLLDKEDYLLHADMFNISNFPTKAKVINCGLGESNLLNMAGGISSQNKNVYIYGVSGFIIHRFEQLKFSCRNFGATKGKIVIFNAGRIGYERLGDGHKLDDDLEIMKILKIQAYTPETLEEFFEVFAKIKSKPDGIYYVQLGKDF